MINTLFFKYKTFGSFALKCGCSYFGVRSFGGLPVSSVSSDGFPTQLVFVFKNYHKALNFMGWLNGLLTFQTDYYRKQVYKNNQMLQLVFVNCALYIKGTKSKLYYKSFPQFCKAQLTVYNKNISHPNQSNSYKRLLRAV